MTGRLNVGFIWLFAVVLMSFFQGLNVTWAQEELSQEQEALSQEIVAEEQNLSSDEDRLTEDAAAESNAAETSSEAPAEEVSALEASKVETSGAEAPAVEAPAVEAPEPIESLDPKIQALKEEILELNTQLFRLQEDLLFPEDSSVVIFLSVQGGHYFKLDSVKIHLNDTLVASHLYTDREVAALGKGGIQRIYQGNLKTGEHQLVAIFTGVGPQQKDYKRAETIQITKEKGATFIKLIVRDNAITKEAEFTYETWN